MTGLPSRYGQIEPDSESAKSEQLSRMITLVSHELKNPLSAIQLTAEMLSQYREHFSEADQEKHLQNLINNTQILKELIDKTSTYCRLRLDVMLPVLQTVEINEFLKNQQIEASEWSDCKHPIQFQPKTEPFRFEVDSFQMKTVLENILKNAMHFSEPGRPILIDWNFSEHRVEISISDQGVGIPDQMTTHLFEPYFRTRDLFGNTGTGLGLTICRQIVDKHLGEIHITDNMPFGTTVKITLPIG